MTAFALIRGDSAPEPLTDADMHGWLDLASGWVLGQFHLVLNRKRDELGPSFELKIQPMSDQLAEVLDSAEHSKVNQIEAH